MTLARVSFVSVLLISSVLIGCSSQSLQQGSESHSSVNDAEQQKVAQELQEYERSQQAASASRATMLSVHHQLSSREMGDGALYLTGGGAQPYSLYYLSSSVTGAVLVTALEAAPYAQRTAVQVNEGKFYYVSSGNDIGIYDLTDVTRSTISVASGLQTACLSLGEGAVQDFLIVQSQLFFISKECTKESFVYRLRAFDLKSQSGRLITDISAASIDNAGIAFVREHTSETSVRIESAYIDAGYGDGKIYDVNFKDGKMQKIANVSYQNCDAPSVCEKSILSENQKFEKYFPWSTRTQCGSLKIEQGSDLIIHRTGTASTISGGMLVRCLMK